MKLDQAALESRDWPDLVAICLWEMTFYGFSEKQIESFLTESKTDYAWRHRLFISHASEDKEDFVRPLAVELQALGLRVWFDEHELRWGDSLRRRIDEALAKCQHGLIILSPAFFRKPWPQYELDGLVARGMEGDRFLLPIWYQVSREEVLRYSPALSDKIALQADDFPTIELLSLRIHDELFFEGRNGEGGSEASAESTS